MLVLKRRFLNSSNGKSPPWSGHELTGHCRRVISFERPLVSVEWTMTEIALAKQQIVDLNL